MRTQDPYLDHKKNNNKKYLQKLKQKQRTADRIHSEAALSAYCIKAQAPMIPKIRRKPH